jgi:hypothetical protein
MQTRTNKCKSWTFPINTVKTTKSTKNDGSKKNLKTLCELRVLRGEKDLTLLMTRIFISKIHHYAK